jgi:TRAP-type transport system periplasmic protein
MTIMRRGIVAAGAAVMMGGAFPAAAQARWQAACPWGDRNCHTRNLRQFLRDVQQATNDALRVRLYEGASLLKASETRQGLQTGQVQIGDLLLAAEASIDPLLELDSIPNVVHGLDEARRLARLSRPLIEQRLQREGLTLLYLAPWPPPGLFTAFAVDSISDLSGTRMRTMAPIAARMASLIGAMSARVEPEDLTQAFVTRVATSMFASAATGVDVDAWQFTRFFTPLEITYPKNAVCAQTRALEALSQPARAALRDMAAAAEERAWDLARTDGPAMQQVLADNGMVLRPPSATLQADLARLGQTMLAEWRVRAGEAGTRLLDALRGG